MARKDGEVSEDLQPKEAKLTPLSKADRLQKLEEAEGQSSTSTTTRPKIQRVPPCRLLDRENSKKYYEPRAVAFGPFHHGKPEYEQAEKFKYKLAAAFIKESGQTREALCLEIEKHIKELRECYEDEATKPYNNDDLASMLFVDGCSILQFIHKHDSLGNLFQMKRDLVAFEEQDLFLLENQVPYKVLMLLMSSSSQHDGLKKSIESFVEMHIIAPLKGSSNNNNRSSSSSSNNNNHVQAQAVDEQAQAIAIQDQQQPPTHLLEYLRRRMLDSVSQSSHDRGSNENDVIGLQQTTFRNVQELKAAGIYFWPSTGKSLKDISFDNFLYFAGFLKLPPIKVDDSMGPKFMNLIAYEMCPDFHNDFGVTSYIAFLDSLIDHPDDVKHLRSKNILHNLLGSDEEVAKLFNQIGTDLVPNDQTYGDVKKKIQRHYENKWKTWINEFLDDHFSSPWTIFAFLGAISALVLSGIQTRYSIS